MKYQEHAVVFECAGEQLVGILTKPERPKPAGVLIIVGGPQYRTGSHRQFVLLSRSLAERGNSVFRFDYRGMGDSTGTMRSFEDIEEDIAQAMAIFIRHMPMLHSVVLWGLCDAASAAMMSAPNHPRVRALVLVNPWARASHTFARVQLRHYYLSRLISASFWRKLISGAVRLQDSARSLAATAKAAAVERNRQRDFREIMLRNLERFTGDVLLVLSGRDLTAKEFLDYTASNQQWLRVLARPRTRRLDYADMDHTFSSRRGRAQLEEATLALLDRVNVTR
jgi:exosortase A-associated hydrolase 1